MKKDRAEDLKRVLEEAEVDKIGIVRIEDLNDTPLPEKAKKLLPGARSVIVLGMEVFSEVIRHLDSRARVGKTALRDLYDRHMQVVSGHLDWEAYKLVKGLHRLGFKALSLPARGAPGDDRFLEGVISYKHVALAAGLGVTGWNSLILTPEYGGRIRLSCLFTSAPLDPSSPVNMEPPCPECGACIRICPVGAIRRPRKGEDCRIDKFACNTYFTASGSCSECLKVCPAGIRRGHR